jgi:hypothetical protein
MGGGFESIQGTNAHILQGELFYYYRLEAMTSIWITVLPPRSAAIT